MLNRILELLRSGGALTVDELARETGVSNEALYGMLDTLARRRLIEWHGPSNAKTNCVAGPTAPPVVTLSVASLKK